MSLATIITRAAEVFDTTPADLAGPSRTNALTEARAAVVAVARVYPHNYTAEFIGLNLRRDHTTIVHLFHVADRLAGDPRWLRRLKEIAR